jgi:hypothetical protein
VTQEDPGTPRWPAYDAPSAYVHDGGVPEVPAKPPRRLRSLALGAGIGLGSLVALVAVLVAVGHGINKDDDYPRVDPTTSDGWARMVTDLANGPDHGRVEYVEMNSRYATIYATGSGGDSSVSYWDGRLTPADGTATGTSPTFDISTVTITDWDQRCSAARRLLGDTEAECSVQIGPPHQWGNDAWVEVRAEAPTSGNATISYDRSGTETGHHVFK